MKKLVRMLLRVSSNQQLEADGDLSVQRQLVKEFVEKNEEWELDSKEYFEGSNSGYKNAVDQRDTLQEALEDAKKGEYDILAAYKDDRVGRRMWEMGAYIMTLKSCGVDVYTVKDGCISPETDDIMGQMILALRYGNAQKSSSDTAMRVKDTAQKLVQKGKFMGGKAPYGYELVLSGELSKHGRALHKLVVVPEQAEIVKYIYNLALNKEYGSSRIAKTLNENKDYKNMAPREIWKGGTIVSILTNPIYTGYVTYKRRERKNGSLRRIDSSEWIRAEEMNEDIKIIDKEVWNRVQEKRRMRAGRFTKSLEEQNVKVIRDNKGVLPLIDVIHCGYCGCKMTNGSKYNYWTIKSTGEKRASKTPIYRCQNARQGMPHENATQYRADEVEQIVFEYIAKYIEGLQKDENVLEEIFENQRKQIDRIKREIRKDKKELLKIQKGIEVMESNIPDAMVGEYIMTLEELVASIRKHKEREKEQSEIIEQKMQQIDNLKVSKEEWNELKENIPTWRDVFMEADTATKRVLINKIVDRIDVTEEQISIHFRISMDEFLSKADLNYTTIPYILC